MVMILLQVDYSPKCDLFLIYYGVKGLSKESTIQYSPVAVQYSPVRSVVGIRELFALFLVFNTLSNMFSDTFV